MWRLELQWVTTCWQDSSKQFQTAWWKYTVHRLFLLVPLICSMPRVTRKISQGILFISQGHIIIIGRWRFLKINKFDKNGIAYCNINGGETGVSAASHLHVCRQQLRLAKLIFMLKHVLYWCGEVWIRLKDPNAGDVCQCWVNAPAAIPWSVDYAVSVHFFLFGPSRFVCGMCPVVVGVACLW